ncbi:hypothetical protein [Chryseobacterium sp. c4a]|uniref:hypothetical protein n=1 Tax=Chryseobacterium sp. c4a TaxID=1573582 RepID=UPI00135758ED|nr:hypothetical protein [Chryseobacterium sp. c4a]
MKKFYLLLGLTTSFFSAQSSGNPGRSFTPPPPSIYEMEKYTTYNVGLQNGVVQYSIPLYTIKLGNTDIPISLNYYTSSLKYGKGSGEVGLGWQLSPLINISRTVNGRPDEMFPMPNDLDVNTINALGRKEDIDSYLSSFVGLSGGGSVFPPVKNYPYQDSEFDIFNYNLGNNYGSFIITNRQNKTIQSTDQNIKIEYNQITNDKIDYIKIFDDKGAIYEMGKEKNTDEKLFCYSNYSLPFGGGSAITAWYVSKITDITGNSAKFDYIDGNESYESSSGLYIRDAVPPYFPSVINSTQGRSASYSTKRIQKITTKNEIITFNREGLTSSIEIRDPFGHLIKLVTLGYKRNMLTSVTIKGKDVSSPQIYRFKYYKEDDLGPFSADYWGNYTDYSTGTFPKYEGGDNIFFCLWNNKNDLNNIANTALKSESGLSNHYLLERIEFPTGGYRRFEYEPHEYNGYSELNKTHTRKTMGIRIKKITSYDGNKNTLIKQYKYGLNEGNIGIVVDDMARSFWFASEGVELLSNVSSIVKKGRYVSLTSTNPFASQLESVGSIYYPQVTVYDSDENEKYSGKIEYYFKNNSYIPYITPYYSNRYYDLESNGCSSFTPNRQFDSYHIPLFSLGLSNNSITKTLYYKNLNTNSPINSNNFSLIKKEENKYEHKNYKSYKGLHINKFATGYTTSEAEYFSNAVESFFDYANYTLEIGNSKLTDKIVTDYFPNKDSITIHTNYTYANPLTSNVTTQKIISADGLVSETSYQYAHDKNNQYLIDKNVIGIPLLTTAIQKQSLTDPGKIISKSETIYPTTQTEANNTTGGLALPKSILNFDLQNPNASQTEFTYDLYNNNGNLLQYTEKDGKTTAIIWGYNNTLPIAKVEGSTFPPLTPYLRAIIPASNIDAKEGTNASEQELIMLLDGFKMNLALSRYQITTYTYDPLVGVTSITPPSGIREVYIYDTANRLKEVRQDSSTGKIIKTFKYNYKNQ